MGRYIERADHLARYSKANYFSSLDAPILKTHDRAFVLESMLYMAGIFDMEEINERDVLFKIGLDAQNSNSIISNITFAENAYHNVTTPVASPLVLQHSEASAQSAWTVSPAPKLPFGAWAQTVESAVVTGPLRDGAGAVIFAVPYAEPGQGLARDQITLRWPEPVSGTVTLRVRIDDPF